MSDRGESIRADISRRLAELQHAHQSAGMADSAIRGAADERSAVVDAQLAQMAAGDPARDALLEERARLHRLVA